MSCTNRVLLPNKDGKTPSTIQGYKVPKEGQKISHKTEGYVGSVMCVTNTKYLNANTVEVVFRGADDEIYSRPLNTFWDVWRTEKYYYIECDYAGMRLIRSMHGGWQNLDPACIPAHAVKYTKERAEEMIDALRRAYSPGTYRIREAI